MTSADKKKIGRRTRPHVGRPWILSLILLLWSAQSSLGAEPSTYRALFVGNSYTYGNGSNNVRGVLHEFLLESLPSFTSIQTEQVAKGGHTFEKHHQDSQNTSEVIHGWLAAAQGPSWRHVILQEQSQIPGFYPYNAPQWPASLNAAADLNLLIEAKDATTVFLMTWGRRNGDSQNTQIFPDYPTMQNLLANGYELYVAEASTPARVAYLAPVGGGFQHIYDQALSQGLDPLNPDSLFYRLYSGDGSHPSVLGSYLMGAVVYATLTGRDPTKVSWKPSAVSAEDQTALLNAAHAVVVEDPFTPRTLSWGSAHRYPWVHAFSELDTSGSSLRIAGDLERITVFVDQALDAQGKIDVGGENPATGLPEHGRLTILEGGLLQTDSIQLGPGPGNGLLELRGGTLVAGSIDRGDEADALVHEAGVLTAAEIRFPWTQAGGSLQLSAPFPQMSILGDWHQLPSATLTISVSGQSHGSLSVQGTAQLQGTISIALDPAAELDAQWSAGVLFAQEISLDEAEFELPDGWSWTIEDLPDGSQRLKLWLDGSSPPPDAGTVPDSGTSADAEPATDTPTNVDSEPNADTETTPDTQTAPDSETNVDVTANTDAGAKNDSDSGGCAQVPGAAGTEFILILLILVGLRTRGDRARASKSRL